MSTHSFWPPAVHRYNAPHITPSVVNSPPSPDTLIAYDAAQAPLLTLHPPKQWPNTTPHFTSTVHTTAQLAYNANGLHILYRIRGPFKAATSHPTNKNDRMYDSRIELFVAPSAKLSNTYHAFELNSEGRALDFKAELTSAKTVELDFECSFPGVKGVHTTTSQLPDDFPYQHLYLMSVPWRDAGVEWAGSGSDGGSSGGSGRGSEADELTSLQQLVNARDMRVAVLRGEVIEVVGESREGVSYPDTHLWTTAVDPDSPAITFHTTTVFMALQLQRSEQLNLN